MDSNSHKSPKNYFCNKWTRAFTVGLILSILLAIFDPGKEFVQWLINLFHDLYQYMARMRDTGSYKLFYLIIGIIITLFWSLIIERILGGFFDSIFCNKHDET